VKTLKPTFKKANSWLLLMIIVVNLYVILTPYLPALLYHWQNRGGTKHQALAQEVKKPAPANPPSTPQPNHLIIPSMLLDAQIYEGPVGNMYRTLDKGIWHYPDSSTPDKGSNTVLLGHRFTYTNPRGVLYYLNKVTVGEELAVYYNNRKYVYKVNEVKEVLPTEVSIQDPTSAPTLTIYTCTPLWLPHDRLVVVANLEGNL
jgi:LPXTG-site transpeptidase (sortase) family protein